MLLLLLLLRLLLGLTQQGMMLAVSYTVHVAFSCLLEDRRVHGTFVTAICHAVVQQPHPPIFLASVLLPTHFAASSFLPQVADLHLH
jgi:Na+-transporting NADH:ubiquinone oxidoreductase subunit NqrB